MVYSPQFLSLCEINLNELMDTFESLIPAGHKGLRDVRNAASHPLHFVAAGVVASGKTTLVHAWMSHLLQGLQGRLNLVELENLEIECRSEVKKLCFESVDPSGSETREFESIEALTESIRQLAMPFKRRLIVRIPKELNERHAAASSKFTIVDTPGFDRAGAKQEIVTYLRDKHYVFLYLVDLTNPNPFGKQGFEILEHLAKELCVSFPPVMVFTKWEELRDNFDNDNWRRQHRISKSLNEMVSEIMHTTAEKLKKAGVKDIPYFAAVNANETVFHSEGEESDTETRVEFEDFLRNLSLLGNEVAKPLREMKCLSVLLQNTQSLRERALKARKTCPQVMETYNDQVDKYFTGIEQTCKGIVDIESPVPCTIAQEAYAIYMIPYFIYCAYEEYKDAHLKHKTRGSAVQIIVATALMRFCKKLVENMKVYEREGLAELKAYIVHPLAEDTFSDLARAISWRDTRRTDLLTGWIPMCLVFAAAFLAKYAGFSHSLWPLALVAAHEVTKYTGFWTWSSCLQCAIHTSYKVLLAHCDSLKRRFKENFRKKVEMIEKSIDASGPKSMQLLHDIRRLLQQKEATLHSKLGSAEELRHNGIEARWLAGDKDLRTIWMSVDWLQLGREE